MVRIWCDDDGIVRLEARGDQNGAVLVAEHDRFYAEEWDAFVAADRWFADYRTANLDGLPVEAVRTLAARSIDVSRRRAPLRIAVLMDPGLGFGLGRMWEQLAAETGWTLSVFTDEDRAWRWLRSTEPPIGLSSS